MTSEDVRSSRARVIAIAQAEITHVGTTNRPDSGPKPMPNPTSGLTIRLSTIFNSPGPGIARGPPRASPAPTRPPTSECDEEDGMPKYQVARFQAIAPSSAARTTTWVTAPGATGPLPSAVATAVPPKAPRKFSGAASRIAARSGSTPVLTTVATALAGPPSPGSRARPQPQCDSMDFAAGPVTASNAAVN
ncbi:MAG TPA: hypothetical protein VKP69_18040 [Isosphaeraceae bacterium]|nr:hypothetical protein [Isosphaeraceae bacterium]